MCGVFVCVWFWLLLGVVETQEADLLRFKYFQFCF